MLTAITGVRVDSACLCSSTVTWSLRFRISPGCITHDYYTRTPTFRPTHTVVQLPPQLRLQLKLAYAPLAEGKLCRK
jgi:hypothetical protein